MSNAIFQDKRAVKYDQFVEDWIPNYHYFIDLIPTILKNYSSKQLLVVGSGTGNEMRSLLETNPHWNIIGVDPSPEMVELAREKLRDYASIQLIEGKVSDLPKQSRFDAATLCLVLHFLPDDGSKLQLLEDISNRLNPDAPLIILDITGSIEHIKQNLQLLKTMIPPEIEHSEVQGRLMRIEKELYHISEERLIELLRMSGFEDPVRFYQMSIYKGWLVRKRDRKTQTLNLK